MKAICLFVGFVFLSFQIKAQNVSFTTPDTVCVNTPVNIINTTTGASSYYWNFCVADITESPTHTNLGNLGGSLSLPVFMDYAFYNGNYYGFVINHSPGNLIRLDFGNSLLNTPTSANLGNFGGAIPSVGTEGIQIVFNEGKWYAIIVGGSQINGGVSPRVLKIEFGINLNNSSPVVTNWGNLGNLAQPIDLHVFKEGNNWYGFTVNAENNTITRFNFTNSFSNTPTADNLGNIGDLNYPTGIYSINDNGYWRVFIVNAGPPPIVSSLSRLDFGSSLLNAPTGVNLGNPGNLLQYPRDLTIMKMCDQIAGFVVNGSHGVSNFVKMDFSNNLSSMPILSSLGNIGNSRFPHSISKLFRVGNDLYSFVTNVDNNTIIRLRFNGCDNSSISSSNLQSPPPIVYNAPGTYNINLTVDDGLSTQATFCKQVVVMELAHSATKNFLLCQGENKKIGSAIKAANYLWNTGVITDSITVNTPGIYWVESSQYGCTVRDSFIVIPGLPPAVLDFGYQQDICTPKKVEFTSGFSDVQSFQWQFGDGQTNSASKTPTITYADFGIYNVKLTVVYNNGCMDSMVKPIIVEAIFDKDLILNKDTAICLGDSVLLRTSNASLKYCWNTSAGVNPRSLNDHVKPNATATYKLVTQVIGNNLVTNGDFSSGNTAFSSEYQFATSNTTEGEYSVNSNPKAWNGALSNCKDHTSGNGQMITVNGSPTAYKKVWTQSVTVEPNTTYLFSAWLQSLYSTNPANLQFSINDANLGNKIQAKAAPCQWDLFTSAWYSGNHTTATLTIVNNNTIVDGNDFALDDIFFGTVATKMDSFTVNVARLCDSIKISGPSKVCNRTDTIVYSIYRSSNCSQTYLLGVDESFADIVSQTDSSVKLVFKQDGSTTVKVAFTNGCKIVRDSIYITTRFSPFQFKVTPLSVNVCKGDSVQFHASGGDFYSWMPTENFNNPDMPTPKAIINQSQNFAIHISDTFCARDTTVYIPVIAKNKTEITITKRNDVDCQLDSTTLIANGGISYSWWPNLYICRAFGNQIVVKPSETTTYYVQSTDASGCKGLDSVTVYFAKEGEQKLFIPNAFTPNQDGLNDIFRPKFTGFFKKFDFKVFNRWGQLIFQTKTPGQGWDGKFKAVLQPNDVYVYIFTAEGVCNGKFEKKGTFVLIK